MLKRTGMPPHTEHTLILIDALLTALAQARDDGYALEYGRQESGVRCVAEPTGLPFLAAITISSPSGRLTLDDAPRIAPHYGPPPPRPAVTPRSDKYQRSLQTVGPETAS